MILLTYIKIIHIIMISKFLKKQKDIQKKKKLLRVMISALKIPREQKDLYLESLSVLSGQWINDLFLNITKFVESVELREISEINKENFTTIVWMRRKEAEDKKKELNAFSFLIHNI